jgi:hypothetical protein
MPYAFVHDVPGDAATYAEIRELVLTKVPPGLISHVVLEHDGGLRHVDVWATREDWERFSREEVGPAVAAVLERHGIPREAAVPVTNEPNLVDIIVGEPVTA